MSRNFTACCIAGCESNRSQSDPKPILHSFPGKGGNYLKTFQWMRIVGGEMLKMDPAYVKRTKRICWLHFTSDCYNPKAKGRLLEDAIPTLLIPEQSDEPFIENESLEAIVPGMETDTDGNDIWSGNDNDCDKSPFVIFTDDVGDLSAESYSPIVIEVTKDTDDDYNRIDTETTNEVTFKMEKCPQNVMEFSDGFENSNDHESHHSRDVLEERTERSFAEEILYIIEQNENAKIDFIEKLTASSQHPIQTLCESLANTVMKFPPLLIIEAKTKISQLIGDLELKILKDNLG